MHVVLAKYYIWATSHAVWKKRVDKKFPIYEENPGKAIRCENM